MQQPITPGRTLWEVFLAYLEDREPKYSTRRHYTMILIRCIPDWLHEPIESVTSLMVDRRHAELKENGERQADLTFKIVRAVINYAMAKYKNEEDKPLYTRQPVEILTACNRWSKKEPKKSRLEPDDIPGWFQATMALEPQHEAARDHLIFLYFTGLRRMEAGALRWDEVDLDRQIVTILNPKNNLPEFLLPLSSTPHSLLLHRRATAKSRYVFPSMLFKDTHISKYDKTYLKVVEATGTYFTPHSLRRTFVSVALELEIELYTVKKLVNHKSGDVTEGYYLPALRHLRDKMQLIDDELLLSIHGQSNLQELPKTA